jgi:hypothetical protein
MINLNIGGAVAHYNTLSKELPILMLKNRGVNFTVYDGPNLCSWNGGRINRDIMLKPEMVDRYNRFGISVALTFSNPVIDLTDETGNDLLEMLNYYGYEYGVRNKVILVNENLRKYIRSVYDFELVYSVSGHDSDIVIDDNLISYYHNLELKYDYIVPKFELVFQPEFYEKIDVSKYELMINDTCVHGCEYWLEHFRLIAQQNELSENPWEEFGHSHCHKTEECWVDGFDPNIKSKEECMDYTPENIKKAKSLGYHSFKISGRENPVDVIISDVNMFLEADKHGN